MCYLVYGTVVGILKRFIVCKSVSIPVLKRDRYSTAPITPSYFFQT